MDTREERFESIAWIGVYILKKEPEQRTWLWTRADEEYD